MFQILNESEVRLMGRKYLYKGEQLFHILERDECEEEDWTFEAWCGSPVENPVVLGQFKVLLASQQSANGWMDSILDLVSDKRKIVMDRWEFAIREALKEFPDGFQLRNLLYPVCRNLGASEDEALAGIAYHPYTGKPINVQGWVATWVEERSPDSRQRYFVAGSQYTSKKPLLFVNDGLYETNTRNDWRPYTYTRGSLWRYDPAAAEARQQPDAEILQAAALEYRKKGMRGIRNRTAVTQDIAGTERVANVAGIAAGFMTALGVAAAMLPTP